MKSKYMIPAVASLLIFVMLFASTFPAFATVTRPVIGPKLVVTTIPEDDQIREKGIIILGLPVPDGWKATNKPWDEHPLPAVAGLVASDLLSQHKLLVTYNGQTLLWRQSGPNNGEYAAPVVACNILEKDKVNPLPKKDGTTGKQFPAENVKTKLIDVSQYFVCKPRWKQPANMPGWYESVGVLDVYFRTSLLPTTVQLASFIADHILSVTVTLVLGRTLVIGSDIQDICVLGWAIDTNTKYITKPDGGKDFHFSWPDALGPFVSCEEAAIWQRYYLNLQGVPAIAGLASD